MGRLQVEPRRVLSRRSFLLAAPFAAISAAEVTGKGRIFHASVGTYLDPATEFPVTRLTDPQFTSYLPAVGNRVLTSRTLLYTSDETGKPQAYRLDLHSRETRQLTDAANLDPASLAFLPGDKAFLYYDSGHLNEADFSKFKTREIYHSPEGAEKLPGISYSEDGQVASFIEKSGSRYVLKSVNRGSATTLVESPNVIHDPLIRPRHPSVLYRSGSEIRLIDFDGQHEHRLELAAGETGQVQWSSNGSVLLYLNKRQDGRVLTSLRSYSPETHQDIAIANTTQFVHFQANADASVFVGASGSKASPYVLLLARAVKRELTLAEHHASNPAMVTPLFSPNSQFVVFVSDRHGKPAIYYMSVEKFVSETGEGS